MKLPYSLPALSLAIVLLLISCKKKEPMLYPDPIVPATLLDSLSGTFVGFRYYHNEYISCPTGAPPCTFTNTYDTVLVTLQVTKYNEDSLRIVDLDNSIATRTIPMQADLTYSGYPINNKPDGHYKLNFTLNPFDSLYLDLLGGIGNSFGGEYTYYTYKLVRQ